MAEKRAVTKKGPMGRPKKHTEGSVNVSTYFPASLAEDLKRYTAYLTSLNGVRRGYSDVLITALLAHRPFREWRKKRDAPG
jgi:hypothetical protein